MSAAFVPKSQWTRIHGAICGGVYRYDVLLLRQHHLAHYGQRLLHRAWSKSIHRASSHAAAECRAGVWQLVFDGVWECVGALEVDAGGDVVWDGVVWGVDGVGHAV